MTDHKFEPFQKVLVRDHVEQRWKANFFSHMDANYFVTGYSLWQYCIPYTPETAHLLGTSQPYEPPKPPVEYEWGQKVILPNGNVGIYIEYEEDSIRPHRVLDKGDVVPCSYGDYEIRPMPDSAAQ